MKHCLHIVDFETRNLQLIYDGDEKKHRDGRTWDSNLQIKGSIPPQDKNSIFCFQIFCFYFLFS